jgi:hypothetical protein
VNFEHGKIVENGDKLLMDEAKGEKILITVTVQKCKKRVS